MTKSEDDLDKIDVDSLSGGHAIIHGIFNELGLTCHPWIALSDIAWRLRKDDIEIGRATFDTEKFSIIFIDRFPYHDQIDEGKFDLADPDSIRKINAFFKAWNI